MAPRETGNNAYAHFRVSNKEHYGMLWYFLVWSIIYEKNCNRLLFIVLFAISCAKQKKKILKLSWLGSPREATGLIRNGLPQLNN